jgi:isoleucyl-tRNA synthetase
MGKYDLPNATKPILEFIDDASNWYVRRSRKRFWKSQNDDDKQDAYTTLHYVLVQLSMIMAPFTPFLAEELYQKLTDGESVHLVDWPEFGHINEQLIVSMAEVRNIITQCLALRSQKSIKVRQPLASVSIETSIELSSEFKDVISEELNVKKVVVKKAKSLSVELDINITQELKNEGLAREVIRNVQQARKDAGLDVENRIILSLNTKSKELVDAINQCLELIKKEVLATELSLDHESYKYTKEVDIENQKLIISLKKAV